MKEELENIRLLKEDSNAAYRACREAIEKLEKETLLRLLKAGFLRDKPFYVASHLDLVYESRDINNPLHEDLCTVLDLTHTTMVRNLYYYYALDARRKVELQVNRFKAKIRLPKDITRAELEEVCEFFGITELDGRGLEYGEEKTKEVLSNYKAIKGLKRKLDRKLP